MKTITCQIQNGKLTPHSEQDIEDLRDFKENQVLRVKISGTRKARSLKQLRTYWAACSLLAENTDDPKWNDREKVSWQLKTGYNSLTLNTQQ